MSACDRYCREAAAALEAARFVSFQPDKDALMVEAQHWLQRASSTRSLPVVTERSSDVPATWGPLFDRP